MPASAALMLIVMFVSFFACIFGIYYLATPPQSRYDRKGNESPASRSTDPLPTKISNGLSC